MKIAMVSSGNSIHVKKIANALVERGHEITLFTRADHTKLLPDFDAKVNVRLLPIKGKMGYFLNVPFLNSALKKEKFDLINSHYASGYGTLSRLTGKHPLVLAVFGSDVYEYPFKSRTNMRRICRNLDNADEITSTSMVMANKVREFYPVPKDIRITPFGVDLSIFYPREKTHSDVFEFGIVKKIEHVYGIDYLLKAYRIFRDAHPDAKTCLAIYGRGSAVEEYRELAEQLGISESVEFRGFIRNECVPDVLSKMDVVCLPSVSESFGVAAVEAMACGIPLIVSDASGFTEVVEHNVTGLIVPRRNEQALADAMAQLYSDADKRKKFGNAGIQRAKEFYNFEKNMDYYEQILMNVVK